VKYFKSFSTTILFTSLLFLAACGTNGSAATSTPMATSTPTTPHLGQTADQILAGLKGKGLPIGTSFTYTATNDPNNLLGRPNEYISKDNFIDTRISTSDTGANITVSDGGAIETFTNSSDAQKRFTYLQSLSTSGNPLFAEYEYLDSTAILRISTKLTADQAGAYQTALKTLP
jgi:hypothetical protein